MQRHNVEVGPWNGREPVVLVIDDDPNNLAIITNLLEELHFTVLAAEDGESGLARAEYARPDLILLDIMMPGIDGFETCRRLKAQPATQDIPVICMTALAETEHKVRGFTAGAVDYITKPFQREEVLARVGVHLRLRGLTLELTEANRSLERRVAERTADLETLNCELQREVEERRQTEEALRASERKFHAIFDHAFQLMGLMTPDGKILESNRTSLAFSGVDESEYIGHYFWDTPWWSRSAELQAQLKDAVTRAAQGEFVRFEVTHKGPDASQHYFDFSIKPVCDDQGTVVLLIPEGRDITERRKLGEQLRQSQKMEAIGTLAGGIAHDFNNILTAIIGFSSLLSLRLGTDHPLACYVDDILAASDRAANLTRSLLSFSRKQVLEPGPERINDIVRKIDKFLLRIIGEDIELKTNLDSTDPIINADSGQIEQVIMNLVTNARDAMPDGGVLQITTERMDVADSYTGFPLEPGSYAVLSVSDSGRGFDETTKQRIFEPFFTTKELGKGTGLGLSIVYGIIQQHDARINVYSEPGRGTTFKIYFKRTDTGVAHLDAAARPQMVGGTETILVAEDDRDVRKFMTDTLREFGYTVIEAVDGEDAVQKFTCHQGEVDLLILDVVMPKMNGREVYRAISRVGGEVRALFSSGYTADIISRKGVLEEGMDFISKPVTPHDLLAKVRSAIS
ncbi:ATP-binding response regulator [Geomesophilobacter sediminis]|uniref:histidine kinase n=1 Tax=Geomesophilobacter sediminis TaxID=2798584 RepID=A0A8J7INU1_9BACT|nr:response regulator [Geomesophilobacter sediminis]MBJ6725013.1 response regulator [Geomesophilobacter sediminis]